MSNVGSCPHCGEPLPGLGDAFCSRCSEPVEVGEIDDKELHPTKGTGSSPESPIRSDASLENPYTPPKSDTHQESRIDNISDPSTLPPGTGLHVENFRTTAMLVRGLSFVLGIGAFSYLRSASLVFRYLHITGWSSFHTFAVLYCAIGIAFIAAAYHGWRFAKTIEEFAANNCEIDTYSGRQLKFYLSIVVLTVLLLVEPGYYQIRYSPIFDL